MNPDFTLIWPLSCLKDGVHLSVRSSMRAQKRLMQLLDGFAKH